MHIVCAGEVVQVVEEAQYLGLHYHNRRGLHASIKKLEQRFWASWIDLQREYTNLRCDTCISLMLDLYLACLPPILSYGCEVWAFRAFAGHQALPTRFASSPLLDAHKRILTQILGVRQNTPEGILLF